MSLRRGWPHQAGAPGEGSQAQHAWASASRHPHTAHKIQEGRASADACDLQNCAFQKPEDECTRARHVKTRTEDSLHMDLSRPSRQCVAGVKQADPCE